MPWFGQKWVHSLGQSRKSSPFPYDSEVFFNETSTLMFCSRSLQWDNGHAFHTFLMGINELGINETINECVRECVRVLYDCVDYTAVEKYFFILQVWILFPFCSVLCLWNIIANSRPFSCYFTNSWHIIISLSTLYNLSTGDILLI